MDPIKIEKLQAMNKYKKSSTQFLKALILYCSTALICSILCLSPFWLPSLYASIKAFLFVSVPNFGVLFINPKCLFIVSNVIVILLIGESKFLSSKSSPDTEIYDEYVKRSSSLRRHPCSEEIEVKETKLEVCLVEENENKVIRVVEEEGEVKEEKGGEEDDEEKEGEVKEKEHEKEEAFDGEDELGLPTEELNRKVEDFIEKINNQRKLEARQLLVCTKFNVPAPFLHEEKLIAVKELTNMLDMQVKYRTTRNLFTAMEASCNREIKSSKDEAKRQHRIGYGGVARDHEGLVKIAHTGVWSKRSRSQQKTHNAEHVNNKKRNEDLLAGTFV
ncbi:hypothetical protein IFM89_026852 [Coptis chinensis]|uniref:DUF4408 domain-containing protein n=1 Tax=Coptis chinensis TaxID=261450 RepID=A0A835HTC9_9MAGN|nr:hypothetical protein IFM89_026852 [Coptis chinensis]